MTQAERQSLALTYPRLATIVASRLVLNAIFRLGYPLVPFIASRFGVSLATAAWVITIQVLAGLASPLGGWLGDHRGYRGTMTLGLTLVLFGTVGVAIARTFPTTVAALGMIGCGTALYQPAMQAYVSDLTPLARRGRALGVVELSWSLAGIVAVPPLIALAEWTGSLTAPFALLAVLILAVILLGQILLPPEPRHHTAQISPVPSRRAIARPALASLLLFMWLALCGQEVLFIAQAPWLVSHFNASPQQIGSTLLVFGLGELLGVSLVAAFADRVGKLRAPLIGFSCAAAIYLLLPMLARGWSSYLLLFMLFAIAFEFAIVSSFALASSVAPTARGTVMAASALATTTGRAAGSRIGVILLEATSLAINGIVAAVLTLIGVLVAKVGVQPQETELESTETAVRLL